MSRFKKFNRFHFLNMEVIPFAQATDVPSTSCLCVGSFRCFSCKKSLIKEYETQRKRAYREKVKERELAIKRVKLSHTKRRAITSQLIKCFRGCTQGLDNDAKGEIITSLLNHHALRGLQFKCQGAEEPSENHKLLINGLHNALKAVKRPKSSRELLIKRASIMMVMTSKKPNIAAASRLLGVHRRNFYAARCRLKQQQSQLPWHLCERQPQTGNVITEEVKDTIIAFWTNNTRVSPNYKDVCRRRISPKVYEKHPVHLLEQPQVFFLSYGIDPHALF